MFYSTIVVYPWIVTIVYWALLCAGKFESPFSTWTNTSQHALNSVYAIFEIIFPRTAPLPFLHLIPVIILLGLYLALAYVTYATEGFFVYSFLDNKTNSSGKVAGYIIGILVAAIIVFLIVRYLITLRVWVTEKKLGKTGKFSHRERTLADGDAEKAVRGTSIN
jgi:signal transduction histidine kinase